jgi:hypothetical protein
MGRHHFYYDSINKGVEDGNYNNPTFRARQHYKEEEVHDPPARRNNDFKPVHSWSAKGMCNYKHAEPFYLLKNLGQFAREENNPGIRWIKRFIEGGLTTSMLGFVFFLHKP